MNFEAIFSGIAVVVSLVNALIVLRIQRDIAMFEVRLIEKLNGRYMNRKEIDLILKERDTWREDVLRKFDHVWARISEERMRHD